ncbi:von Willebrand factor type A domain-containing protein [Thermomonospora echinospora]|uniref:von Willebrand factor type A domain-containing protein n=1 Tax=Thermomonospora echinospora TaxID=1992 RepID=A0A1H5TDJ0_9ACTN|nr:vWA domain-containing protein [Thermomonospora echinospora]SEF60866.1 von Willebrand factor type A domain-containing protein [Thermomonospora echinospora]
MTDEQPRQQPRRQRRGRSLPTLVVLPLVLLSVWIDQGVIKVHWLIATAVIAAVILLEEFRPSLPGWLPHLEQKARRRYGSAAAAVVIGAAVVFSGWTLAGWSQTRLSACEPPAELRVMVATEMLRTMRAKAEEFAVEQAEGVRCRPVHVTVFAAPPMRPLVEAFSNHNGWLDQNPERSPLAGIGPRPDLWLASASAVAEYVTEPGVKGGRWVSTEGHPTVSAASPIVLAVSTAAAKAAGTPAGGTPDNWEEVVEWAGDKGVTLLRPTPDTSDVAMVATSVLYEAAANDSEEHHRREQRVSPPDTPLTGVDQMLCHVRERLADDRPYKVALMVPEHSLAAYNRGEPLGGTCARRLSRAEAADYQLEVVRPRRTPLLDYSTVQIAWDDEQDAERSRLVTAFQAWLAAHGRRLGPGFEPPGGSGTATPMKKHNLETTISQINATRRARTLLFALDRSGSMKAPVTGGTAIGRARALVREATGWLGDNDQAGLWAFPSGGDGREPEVLAPLAPTEEAVSTLPAGLGGLETEGSTTPLHHVIVRGLQELREKPNEGSLVVLTDGDNDAGRHADEDLKALRTELRESRDPRVYLVVVGERGCDKALKDLLAGSRRARCLPFGASTDARQVVNDLFTNIWKD